MVPGLLAERGRVVDLRSHRSGSRLEGREGDHRPVQGRRSLVGLVRPRGHQSRLAHRHLEPVRLEPRHLELLVHCKQEHSHLQLVQRMSRKGRR